MERPIRLDDVLLDRSWQGKDAPEFTIELGRRRFDEEALAKVDSHHGRKLAEVRRQATRSTFIQFQWYDSNQGFLLVGSRLYPSQDDSMVAEGQPLHPTSPRELPAAVPVAPLGA
jgi:hypothetical protein